MSQNYKQYLIVLIVFILFMIFNFYFNYEKYFQIFLDQMVLKNISVNIYHTETKYKASQLIDEDEQSLRKTIDQIYLNNQTKYKNDTLYEYRLIHESIMNGKLSIKISVNSEIPYGYGNRLYSLLSTMVIALVTDSALNVKWKMIDKYINEPFLKTFYNFSNQSNEFNIEFNSTNVINPKSLWSWRPEKPMEKLIETSFPIDKTRFLYNDIDAYFFELCSNPDYYDKFFYYGLVSRETLLKAHEITYNMKNKLENYTSEYKQDIILQVPFEVGGNLLNKMWIPKDHIMKKVEHYVNNIFKDYYMIGIQLRYEYLIDPLDTYKFLTCSFEIEANITQTIPNFISKYKGVKWFVTSDSADMIDRLKKDYPNKIIDGEGQLGHIDSDQDFYPRTILDVELLSRCNQLILTGGSTYGNFY
jgi:hypothetical protein